MNKLLLSALLTVGLAAPALADHHGQSSKKGHHGVKSGAKHKAAMNAMMADGKLFSARAIDLLTMGNTLVEKGAAKQDAEMLLQGAQMLMMGRHMHHKSMTGMKKMQHTMKHHLMHAKIGDMEMSAQEMDQLEKEMNALKREISASHGTCSKQMHMIPQSASKLVKTGNALFMAAQKEQNAAGMLKATEVMQKGMKLHMMLQGKHEGHGKSKSKGHGHGSH